MVISVVATLLVAAANIFPPVPGLSYTGTADGVASATSYDDFLLRFSMIFFGLILTVIAAIISLTSLFFSKHTAGDKLANLSILVFVFVIGWMGLPYWANGLYYVFSSGTTSLYDPKALLPMTLMGEIWRIPVLVFYPVILAYLLFSLIRFMVIVFRRKNPGIINVMILIYNLLIIVTFFFVPHYFYWLLD